MIKLMKFNFKTYKIIRIKMIKIYSMLYNHKKSIQNNIQEMKATIKKFQFYLINNNSVKTMNNLNILISIINIY